MMDGMDAQESGKTKGLKVIGVGFGRTGTSTLKIALEELGFGPCYHFEELYKHRSVLARWEAAARGELIDWNEIFGEYAASADWPACAFYKELMKAYPDAKLILTVRNPESWYDSAKGTIYEFGKSFRSSPLAFTVLTCMKGISPFTRRLFRFADDVIWQGTFHNRFEDKDYTINIFKQHIEEVKRLVPPEKLLVYEVKEGWEPLCDFLGVAIPADRPFLHLNKGTNFLRLVLHRMRLKIFHGVVDNSSFDVAHP
ncbi:MAG: sulfotransferase family protein [Ktedonobacteraceae bacterium]